MTGKDAADRVNGLPPGYFTTPLPARVYDYWLGGKDNFAADREAGEMLLKIHPGLRTLARENRAFICGSERHDGAVRWLARNKGIRQFIDAGCGLPAWPSVHDAARSVIPDAVVAYADRDPLVMSHVRALQAGEGLAAVEADAEDPGAILGHPDLGSVIDLSEPAAVIFGGTLSYMAAAVARDTVPRYAAKLAPGSAVVISCAHFDDQEVAAKIASVFADGTGGPWRNHSREDVGSFLGGLRVEGGRTADVRCWPVLPSGNGRDAAIIGGIGIKP